MSEVFVCPDTHKHAENSTCRSLHHCKCEPCREGAKEYEFWRQGQLRAGRPLRVSAVGSVRRLHALQRLGWPLRAIAEAAGYSESWAHALVRQAVISRRTAETVRAVYDVLSMRLPPETCRAERASVARARNYAARQGWAPPLAWDEESIDDPAAVPAGMEKAA